MRPDHGYPHIEMDSCRALWCNVLSTAWEDALHPSVSARPWDIAHARNWFGGRDFRLVCAAAGIDADQVLMKFRQALAEGDHRATLIRKRIAA